MTDAQAYALVGMLLGIIFMVTCLITERDRK